MSQEQFKRRVWIYVLAGIIFGLLIGAGLQWTHSTIAAPPVQPTAQSENEMQMSSSSSPNVAVELSNVFASVAKNVTPSVVTIFTETKVKAQQQQFGQLFGDDFFKKFFQVPAPQQDQTQESLGSGVIVTSDGTILTNNHVVKGADKIKVKLNDGTEYEAKVKGTDVQTDLAVITIDAKGLTPINFGDSDKARVGDWVLAIGSPLNFEHTVTSGIISSKGRTGVGLSQYEDYLQTDAAINPGNSGGALVNVNGELIGINSAIATQTGGFQGIGFAIPVNLAKKIMDDIIKNGKVVRGWLGVYIQNITPDLAKGLNLKSNKGVVVSKVEPNSPADKAGLKAEDVITQFNGKDVDNSMELSTWVASTSPDTKITLQVIRNGKVMSVPVMLGELNPQTQELARGESSESQVGLTVANITPDLIQKYQLAQNQPGGVVVIQVAGGSIAAEVGLQPGDVILKVNRQTVKDVKEFNSVISKIKSGENILFYLRRGEGNFFVAFTMP